MHCSCTAGDSRRAAPTYAAADGGPTTPGTIAVDRQSQAGAGEMEADSQPSRSMQHTGECQASPASRGAAYFSSVRSHLHMTSIRTLDLTTGCHMPYAMADMAVAAVEASRRWVMGHTVTPTPTVGAENSPVVSKRPSARRPAGLVLHTEIDETLAQATGRRRQGAGLPKPPTRSPLPQSLGPKALDPGALPCMIASVSHARRAARRQTCKTCKTCLCVGI